MTFWFYLIIRHVHQDKRMDGCFNGPAAWHIRTLHMLCYTFTLHIWSVSTIPILTLQIITLHIVTLHVPAIELYRSYNVDNVDIFVLPHSEEQNNFSQTFTSSGEWTCYPRTLEPPVIHYHPFPTELTWQLLTEGSSNSLLLMLHLIIGK